MCQNQARILDALDDVSQFREPLAATVGVQGEAGACPISAAGSLSGPLPEVFEIAPAPYNDCPNEKGKDASKGFS